MSDLRMLFGLLGMFAVGCGVGHPTSSVPALAPDPSDRPIYGIAISPDGRTIASFGHQPFVRFETDGSPPVDVRHDNLTPRCIAFHPRDDSLLAGYFGGDLVLWEKRTDGFHQRTVARLADDVRSCTYSTDGRFAATGAEDGTIIVWATCRWRRHCRLNLGAPVWCVRFSKNGEWLVAAGQKGLRIWSVKTGEERMRLTGHRGIVASAAFTPDGRYVVSSGHDATVRLWNLNERREVWCALTNSHNLPITDVAVSPDGKLLVACGLNESVLAWNLQSRQAVAIQTNHYKRVTDMHFSAHNRTLITAGVDGEIHRTRVPD